MKVKFIGENNPLALLNGKIYDVISIERDWYRIIDEDPNIDPSETVPGYLYAPELFEIVEK